MSELASKQATLCANLSWGSGSYLAASGIYQANVGLGCQGLYPQDSSIVPIYLPRKHRELDRLRSFWRKVLTVVSNCEPLESFFFIPCHRISEGLNVISTLDPLSLLLNFKAFFASLIHFSFLFIPDIRKYLEK